MGNILPVITLGNKERWMGVVLCGGEPSQTGQDKGLLKEGEVYYAEQCAKILSKNINSVVFSVNEKQFPKYKNLFKQAEIIIDSNKIGGPITGILSVFSAFRIFHFMVLGCDMINMNPDILKYLQYEYKKDPNHDFYVFRDEQEVFYSCGIYTNKGLEKLYNLHNKGNLHQRKVSTILQSYDTKYLPIEDSWRDYFKKKSIERVSHPSPVLALEK